MKFLSRKKRSTQGRVAIAVGPDAMQVAYANSTGQVVFCRVFDGHADRMSVLEDLIEEYGWQDMACSVVLHPAYYQLVQIEAPKVPDEELSTALRWKVKDLLDFPLADAAIEFFSLPADAYRGQRRMVYVAALRKANLQSLINPIETMGLAVDCVEITELALHKVLQRLPPASGGTALMSLLRDDGLINLVEENNIYLCRHIDIGFTAVTDTSNARSLEALVLEIQRSLDFYESQLGKGVIRHLYFTPPLPVMQSLNEFLNEQLGLNVAPLPVPEQVSSDLDVEEVARCLSAIGAVLGVAHASDTEAFRAAH